MVTVTVISSVSSYPQGFLVSSWNEGTGTATACVYTVNESENDGAEVESDDDENKVADDERLEIWSPAFEGRVDSQHAVTTNDWLVALGGQTRDYQTCYDCHVVLRFSPSPVNAAAHRWGPFSGHRPGLIWHRHHLSVS